MEHLGFLVQMAWHVLHYMLNPHKQKLTLKRKLQELERRAADISVEVEHAESSSRKRRKSEVLCWMNDVERVMEEGERILQENDLSIWSALFGCRVERMTADVIECIKKGRFKGGLVLDAHDIRGDLLLTVKMAGQEFQTNMHKILEYLGNEEMLRIGIYGMGGVGKTTLVTHIHNKVLAENQNAFGCVYWVTVTQDCGIYSLQNLLAKTIGYNIHDEEDEKKRAGKLTNAFKRRGKCVLILDDMWKHFSEEEVGIPIKVNGCKLILTSRSLEVCRQMDCDVKILVQPLSEEESCNLFVEKLGCKLPPPLEIEEITKSVVKECGGLPLGIITMARSMRGVDDVCEWRNALKELKESKIRKDDMEDEVFKVLRFSYKRLNDRALEQCFLYCALYPEDYRIERGKLIEYLIVEGIIERMSSRQEQFDRGHVMLNKLENACLLEGSEVDTRRYVKMHDLVRDMAIQIMKEGPLKTMVESSKQLKEIPDHVQVHWTEDLLRVSLNNNEIREIPSIHSPRCPNMVTLLLWGNIYLRMIDNSFFDYLPGLKVLDLSCTKIQRLPHSVGYLENLDALLLRYCKELIEIPSLANLKALKKLDLRFTGLEEAPKGMELLRNLTYLNLIGSQIKNLRFGILSKLHHLQYLGFNCTSEMSEVVKQDLTCLDKLETLICWFHNFGVFNSYSLSLSTSSVSQQLRKYHLFVGPDWGCCHNALLCDDLNLISQSVEFDGNSITSKEMYLPSNSRILIIGGDLTEDVRGLCLKNAIELKFLGVEDCKRMEYLFDLSSSPCIFHSLETIVLGGLYDLRVLFSGDGDVEAPSPTLMSLPPNTAFSNLKTFLMSFCDSMRKVLHPALIRNLRNLEVLEISRCSQMEEIIAAEEQDDEGSGRSYQIHMFVLPKLKSLKLMELPNLKSICSEKIICDCLQTITLRNCGKLENIPLSLPLPSLQELQVYPQAWWESVEWNHSTDKSVLQHLCK